MSYIVHPRCRELEMSVEMIVGGRVFLALSHIDANADGTPHTQCFSHKDQREEDPVAIHGTRHIIHCTRSV